MEISLEILRLQMQRQAAVERLVGALCRQIVSNPDDDPLLHKHLRNWVREKLEAAERQQKVRGSCCSL
jgi:hypothetical protein